MQTSDYLGLTLQEQTDNVNIDVISENFKTTEKAIKDTNAKIISLTKVHIGSYTGDDVEERILELGFEPVAVIVNSLNGEDEYFNPFSMTIKRYSDSTINGIVSTLEKNKSEYKTLEIVKDGFKVFNKAYYEGSSEVHAAYLNESGRQYMYIAFEG